MSRTRKSTRAQRSTGVALVLLLIGGLAAYMVLRPGDYADGWPDRAAPPNRAAVDAAAASVVRVWSCPGTVCDPATPPVDGYPQVIFHGSGWVVAPGRVITTAHLVAGAHSTGVQVGGTDRVYQGVVVLYDPARDLAVLAVPELHAPALALGETLHRFDPAIIAGFPDGGSYAAKGTLLVEHGLYTDPDSFLNGLESYRLTGFGQELLGCDGGPLLDGNGHVVGIAYPSQGLSGLALTLDAARPVLDAAAGATTPVSTGTVEMPWRL